MVKIDRAQEAARTVAEKLAGKHKNSTQSNHSAPTAIATDTQIAGLINITPDHVAGMMPTFKPEQYHVADPLNPPATLPQVSESQFDKGMQIYQSAIRATKLTGAAFDFKRETFVTVGKHAKAIGAGIQAATEIEKVRGNYLDYLNQKEITTQKTVTLDVSQAKTTTDTNIAVYSKDELNQKLKQAELKAEELRLKTVETQGKLDSFKSQLGNYIEAK